MKLLSKRRLSHIPLFCLAISVVVSWLIIPADMGFPMVVFFVFFVSVSSLVFWLRREKTWFESMLYLGILVLSFFLIYRANGFLQFFDFFFIFFFGSLLIRPLLNEYGVFSLLLSPLIVIKDMLITKNIYPYTFKIPTNYLKASYFREYLPSVLITAVILFITVPLLASANPFFNMLLQNILKAVNLQWLVAYLFTDSLTVYIFRFVIFLILAYCIPKVLSVTVQRAKREAMKPLFSINYLLPKIALGGVLVIFFITQLQLYFASPQTLQSIGYTNSRLTNEVFAQVTIVAFIVFLLAYLDKRRTVWHTRLTYFLVVEAFFLIGIAFKSVYDYSSLYGFTQKRLWGYASMTWLTGALAFFIYHYKQQTTNLSFIKQVLTHTMGVILLINVLNFDYVIAHYSKPTVAGNVDYVYLSDLSTDAHNYYEVLPKLMEQIEKNNQIEFQTFASAYHILSTIDYLKDKYDSKKNINSFNISEYQEYLKVKNIETEAYRKKVTEKEEKLNTPQKPSSNT